MGDGPRRTSSGTRAKRPVLLVADDDLDFLPLLLEFLVDEGFDVVPATTGKAALSLARAAARPDAIILDLTLPDVDGMDVARELRADERTRNIPIILLTVRDVEASDVADLDLDGALTKPCAGEVLLERLRAALKRSGKSRIA
jgi:DNA-binding response OmpR family regulator